MNETFDYPELPRRTPGATDIPHYRTAAPSMSLLLRVASGVAEWAERDRQPETSRRTDN